ncbi:MAG: hypothetical protein PHN56_05735 [Candidatus Nanoarchaeia archaeon]|nr:hypothetical protein [Candidatus Nanoarchaeia archaeon]
MYEFDDNLLKLDNFEEGIKKISSIKEIMTTEIKYYESFESDEEREQFCKDRKIDSLPLKDKLEIWEYNKKSFRLINKDEIIDNADCFIYNDNLIDFFSKDEKVKFIINNKKIIGLMHFVDYNRKQAYIYPYFKFIEFESLLREYIKIIGKEKDYLNNIYKKSGKKVEKIEDTGFIELLKFCRENQLIDSEYLIINNNDFQGKINFLRNNLMHIKYNTDLIKDDRIEDFNKNNKILNHIIKINKKLNKEINKIINSF